MMIREESTVSVPLMPSHSLLNWFVPGNYNKGLDISFAVFPKTDIIKPTGFDFDSVAL